MERTYKNRCYRSGPCLFADQRRVTRADDWDYYDRRRKAYIQLDCRIHNKYYSPSPPELEEEQNWFSGMATETREYPDLQLHDSDGVWFTRSDDPECYYYDYEIESTPKTCTDCETICDIRNWDKYLNPDGTCPYPDPPPQPIYWKIEYDRTCNYFLHPLLLQDIDVINRKRRKMAKARIWKYLKEPRWMHRLISKEKPIMQAWMRNYEPAKFYFNSFESILLYVRKAAPAKIRRDKRTLQLIRSNLEKSPSFSDLLDDPYEEYLLERLDETIAESRRKIYRVEIYTDGLCSDRPGSAGIGVVLKSGRHYREISRPLDGAAGSNAELQAVIEGLKSLKYPEDTEVSLHTNSEFVKRCLTGDWEHETERDLASELLDHTKRCYKMNVVKLDHPDNQERKRCGQLAEEAVRSYERK